MIEIRTTTIEGIDFEYNPLQLKPARRNLDKLIKEFGHTVGSFVEALKGLDSKAKTAELAEPVGVLVKTFSRDLKPETHDELVSTFLSRVSYTKDGQKILLTEIAMEELFASNLYLETQVLVWCLSEQYRDFLKPLLNALSVTA